jgi:hypothetical protein
VPEEAGWTPLAAGCFPSFHIGALARRPVQ